MKTTKITTDIITTIGFTVDIPTAKVVINNQEITDLETFDKVVDSIKEKDKEIERLNNIINAISNILENYGRLEYYYKYDGKYLKSEIIKDLKECIELKEGK